VIVLVRKKCEYFTFELMLFCFVKQLSKNYDSDNDFNAFEAGIF